MFVDCPLSIGRLGCLVLGCLAYSSLNRQATATELDGFTEPLRTIKVASDETGTIADILVEEGTYVHAGQTLARLNSEIHEALLAIANQNMKAEGRLLSIQADLQLRESRLSKLREIRHEGFARQEEVDRAEMELEVAKANLHAAKEDVTAKQLEHKKALAQLGRRTIYSPIDGTVTVRHRDRGEFVAPNAPEIVTVAQLDVLLANFTLTGKQAATVKKGDSVTVAFSDGDDAQGTVEFIAPVMDAESGSVLIKVRIDNSHQGYRSGQRCRLRLPD